MELFDTEVDSIRTFDSLTQRSIEALSDISVYPCSHIAKDHEVFEAAGKRITRAYDLSLIHIFAEIYAAREKNIYKISSKSLMNRIKEEDPAKDVYFFSDFEEIANFVYNNAEPGDLVITMGAGDIYKVGEMILEKDKRF